MLKTMQTYMAAIRQVAFERAPALSSHFEVARQVMTLSSPPCRTPR